MDSEKAALIRMVENLRVKELKELSEFIGLGKYGNRSTLLERCLVAVKEGKIPELASTIRELHLERYKIVTKQPPITIPAVAAPPTPNGISEANGANAPCMTSASAVNNAGAGLRGTFLSSLTSQLVINGYRRSLPLTSSIKMIQLPFFEVNAVLLQPTVLVSQNDPEIELALCEESFRITKEQYGVIVDSYQREMAYGRIGKRSPLNLEIIHLRFCALDPAVAEQVDMLPRKLEVKVNGSPLTLPRFLPCPTTTNTPKMEPLRQAIPILIPAPILTLRSDNIISVQWERNTNGRDYAMAVHFVKVLTAFDLFKKMKREPPEVTKERVNEIISESVDGIAAPTFVPVSLICPLGKARINYPCRAITCSHIQCFDAEMFLRMNEVKPKFKCPVCNVNLKCDDLRMDLFHGEILRSLPKDDQVELYPSGKFKPAVESRKSEVTIPSLKRKRVKGFESRNGVAQSASGSKIVCVDLDEEDVVSSLSANAPASASNSSTDTGVGIFLKAKPEVINIAESDEEETPKIPADKVAKRKPLLTGLR